MYGRMQKQGKEIVVLQCYALLQLAIPHPGTSEAPVSPYLYAQ